MRGLIYTLIPALFLAGCDSARKKADNPVMGPPPPRTAELDRGQSPLGGQSSGSEIRLAGADEGGYAALGTFEDTQVVATVNGAPIFASEVLEPYGPYLTEARKKLSQPEYEKFRRKLIARDLNRRVERKILIESLRETLAPEQVKQLNGHLDSMFENEISKMKQQLNVSTNLELDQQLQKQGTSLAKLRDEFSNQRMSMEYLGAKTKVNHDVTRQDMLQYYNEHLDEYATPARVKWQQIQVSFSKNGGRRGAQEVVDQVVKELRAGADFGAVVRKYSDGPTVSESGVWDWTQAGSLADKEVEQALFELPEGTISQVIEGQRSYQIVRILKSEPAGHKSFAGLQDEIKKTLQQDARKQATQKVLDELHASAVVETIFDKDPQSDQGVQPAVDQSESTAFGDDWHRDDSRRQ